MRGRRLLTEQLTGNLVVTQTEAAGEKLRFPLSPLRDENGTFLPQTRASSVFGKKVGVKAGKANAVKP
jgi:hypothetical protein